MFSEILGLLFPDSHVFLWQMDDLGTSIALDVLDTDIAGLRLSMAMAISSPVDFFLKHQ